MSYVTLLHLPFFSIFYFQNKLILKLFYSIKICLRMCLRDLHEKNEHIETVLEFTQNRKNNRERELYKSISSFLVSVFSAPTHPPSIHTLSESVELNRCESVTESNHVGRRTPFRIQGRCWSLQDLSSTSRNHPQKRLHRHQGSSLQGSSFFDSSTPDFFLRMLYRFIQLSWVL